MWDVAAGRPERRIGADFLAWREDLRTIEDLGAFRVVPRIAGRPQRRRQARETAYPLQLAVHVRGDAQRFTSELRRIAAAVDPTLRLYDPLPLDEVNRHELRFYGFWFSIVALVSGVALLLSLAGIYAVMAFTVARRTREIGIRIALGCPPHRLVPAILRRPLLQVAGGILAGALLVTLLSGVVEGSDLELARAVAVAGYALLMTGVCMTACIVPTRRALRVEPTEALRSE